MWRGGGVWVYVDVAWRCCVGGYGCGVMLCRCGVDVMCVAV